MLKEKYRATAKSNPKTSTIRHLFVAISYNPNILQKNMFSLTIISIQLFKDVFQISIYLTHLRSK